MRYGSGSKQQIVTCDGEFHDWNGLWLLKEAHASVATTINSPIKCGDSVRFEHVNTGRNLHSHAVPSWIAKGGHEEVSGFGEQGRGDYSDNWTIECDNKPNGELLFA